MHADPHRIAKRFVHRLMPFDEPFALEHVAYDQRLKMIAAAGGIADFDHRRVGNPPADHALYFARVHRRYLIESGVPIPLVLAGSQMLNELLSSGVCDGLPGTFAPFIRSMAFSLNSPGFPAPRTF